MTNDNNKKILIIVQRYGLEVNGGSEVHARAWAHRLAKKHIVTVATTCAKDDRSWENYYVQGESRDGLVRVKRFCVDKTRDLAAFSEYSSAILSQPQAQSLATQEEWMTEQGPVSLELFQFLEECSGAYDVVIFFTYLYATTVFGLRCVSLSTPVILVPTAHDEPPVYLPIFKGVFERPNLIAFSTEAERRFCYQLFPNIKCSTLVACGIDGFEEQPPGWEMLKTQPYFVYVGRIAHGKGMPNLFKYFQGLPESLLTPLRLLGQVQMDCPQSACFQYLGFVSEAERTTQIRNALAMIVPSPFESLSLSTLESWALKIPVLVNGWCPVLVDHVKKSQGGLIYRDRVEFRNCVEYALTHPEVMIQLGEQGYEYAKKYYSWPVIEEKLERSISAILSSKNFTTKLELEV